MSSVTVDELVMRIEIELDKFRSEATQAENIDKRLRDSLKNTEASAKKTGEQFGQLGEDVGGANEQLTSNLKVVKEAAGGLVRLFGIVLGSNAITRLTNAVADANDQLQFLSQRLGMNARDIRAVDAAVAALGGSGAGAIATMRNLQQGIQEMVLMGNDALIPFFSALGVGVVDAYGEIREMDAILMDMADSLSAMDPQQAYALAQAMGIDEGVANTLIQGRDALQDMLDLHESIYVSTEAELRASRELKRAQGILSAQWQGLTTIIGNALIPHLLRMTELVSGWMDYLNRNERTVRNVFEGLAIAIGVVLTPILIKAGMAMLALVAPILGTVAAVGLLATGFALLYDDYKTWADGGESLFDWSAFERNIMGAKVTTDSLAQGFARLLTGYDSLSEAGEAFMEWLRDKGIIDEFGVSVRGLGEAFKDLAADALSSVPGIRIIGELISAVQEGRMRDIPGILMQIPTEQIRAVKNLHGAAVERAAGAADTMLQTDGIISRGMARARSWLFGNGDDLDAIFREAEERAGLPAGTLRAIQMQETSGKQDYIDDPSKYHYALDENGSRVAPHTGQVSTAFGPFGILESTARDPGFGVAPLADKSLEEQARFAAEYLAARARHAGGLEAGLAGYGEGQRYADSVMGMIPSAEHARNMSRTVTVGAGGAGAGRHGGVEVNVGSVTVQTSATTLPSATADGVAAGIEQGADLLNQLGGGLQ